MAFEGNRRNNVITCCVRFIFPQKNLPSDVTNSMTFKIESFLLLLLTILFSITKQFRFYFVFRLWRDKELQKTFYFSHKKSFVFSLQTFLCFSYLDLCDSFLKNVSFCTSAVCKIRHRKIKQFAQISLLKMSRNYSTRFSRLC